MIPALIFFCLPCRPGQNAVEKGPAEEAAWRAERDREMRSEESWLTIAGLFWLDEGENTFGASSSKPDQTPARPGSLTRREVHEKRRENHS